MANIDSMLRYIIRNVCEDFLSTLKGAEIAVDRAVGVSGTHNEYRITVYGMMLDTAEKYSLGMQVSSILNEVEFRHFEKKKISVSCR